MVDNYVQTITKSYQTWQPALIDTAIPQGKQISSQEVRDLRREIIERMAQDGMPPRVSVTYDRQISAYRRVRDHALNVAEAIVNAK